MKPVFKVEYRGLPKLAKKAENEFIKQTMRNLGYQWHREFMPEHFTTRGAKKYRYKGRKTKNIFTGEVKRRKKSRKPLAPSGLPIVWTGKTREEAKSKRVRATSRIATVSVHVRNLNRYKPKGNKKLNMAQELRTVIKKELTILEKDGTVFLENLLRAYSAPATVTIRG